MNENKPESVPPSTVHGKSSLKNDKKGNTLEAIRFIFIVLLIVIPIRIFIAQPFIVSGESMAPTFSTSDYLIVDQISYRVGQPERGDVMIFRYPNNPSRFFIKRVIGLPGETIVFEDTDVKIINQEHPEGIKLEEPYIKQDIILYQRTELSDSQYFVMGDNRGASSDSRFWGPLDEKFIVGRAAFRLLPPKNMSVLPGDYRSQYLPIN